MTWEPPLSPSGELVRYVVEIYESGVLVDTIEVSPSTQSIDLCSLSIGDGNYTVRVSYGLYTLVHACVLIQECKCLLPCFYDNCHFSIDPGSVGWRSW